MHGMTIRAMIGPEMHYGVANAETDLRLILEISGLPDCPGKSLSATQLICLTLSEIRLEKFRSS